MTMNRRNFIKITGLGVSAVVLGSQITGCKDSLDMKQYGWKEPDLNQKDMRLKVLTYAMMCPNPHNKQPWLIDFTAKDSFDLYVDPDRLLPATDPYHRQIHIGQGTFLETLSIAASGLGMVAKINYFPQGMYGNKELLKKPVASITLLKSANQKADPLFNYLLTRQSNKQEYDKQGLNIQQINDLKKFHQQANNSQFSVVNDFEAKSKLEYFLTESMRIETGNIERDKETIAMFRFNDQEIKRYRDGFGVAQAGMSGIKKFIAESFFLSRDSVEENPKDFGLQAVELTKNTAESTQTFGWLNTVGNSRLDQVKVGRDYCRINLKMTKMGLAIHPMSQVLEEYADMLPLQSEFRKAFNIHKNETVQMLFRLGKADPTVHGPRRLVSELIMS